LCVELVLVPLLDTVHVGYGPADGTGPDTRGPYNFAGADDAFILAAIDVFVNPGGQVLRGGFRLLFERDVLDSLLVMWPRTTTVAILTT
jgi:hypothetical protein